MRVEVNGVRLFFDVEGAKLVPDGPTMREKPTLILLHGGPGGDHSQLKPPFSVLADEAQLIYLDHRGNGRSDYEPREAWNLEQWGDDVFEFCRALDIEKPIVCGGSFGGMVAQSYATRHPEHPGKLILISTAAVGIRIPSRMERMLATIERRGGPIAARVARELYVDANHSAENYARFEELCLPLWGTGFRTLDGSARTVGNPSVAARFNRRSGEFDLLSALAQIACPTLVIHGDNDPICPVECAEEMVAAMRIGLARFERLHDCSHWTFGDDGGRTIALIREFILS